MANDEEAGCESSARSAGSEALTSGSPAPGGSTTPSASATSTAAQSSPSGSPEFRSGTTFALFMPYRTLQADGSVLETFAERPTTDALLGPSGNKEPLVVSISSAAVSRVRTSPSPDDGQGSRASDPACSSSSPASLSLFDPSGFSSRTYPDCSPRTAVGTSESCLERWPTSGTAWHGGFSTAASSECPSADGVCSSSATTLADVLEPSAPARYSLSAKAAAGILRRAEKRGRTLPESLAAALSSLARS